MTSMTSTFGCPPPSAAKSSRPDASAYSAAAGVDVKVVARMAGLAAAKYRREVAVANLCSVIRAPPGPAPSARPIRAEGRARRVVHMPGRHERAMRRAYRAFGVLGAAVARRTQ